MSKKKWILLLICICGSVAVITGCGIRKNNDTVEENKEPTAVITQAVEPEENPEEKPEVTDTADKESGSEEKENKPEVDWDAFNEILSDIYNAMPGVSGCSLKAAGAAGELLDWAKQYMSVTSETEIKEKAQSWYDANKEELVEVETIMLAWEAVYEDAQKILTDRDSILPLLDDAGYELQNDSYDANDLDVINKALTEAFPEAPEGLNE